MVKAELTIIQLKHAIAKLPVEKRARLIRDLNAENWARDLRRINRQVAKRRAQVKLSWKDISAEISKARREFYAGRA